MLTTLLALALLQAPDGGASAPQDPVGSDARPAAEPEAWFSQELAARCATAAERGLTWLREHQLDSGAWVGFVGHKMQDDYEILATGLLPEQQRKKGEGHLGVTALCGMAFLAGGHLPDRGEHGDAVRLAQDFVLTHSLENGMLTAAGTRMYSHAFATLFLAEVHGMAADDRTKLALERAVNLIVDSQNQVGGWRYNPFDRNTDLSVTVCQLQALRAARNIGIRVPNDTIERAMAYVDKSRVSSGAGRGLYYYKIYGNGAYQKSREYAINAAAMTALASAGVHDDDLADPVLTFLERSYPDIADYYSTHFYFWYGNYYAAQAFYQYGGPRLAGFYQRLAEDLLRGQCADGRWRNDTGPGDEMATAVACILLQMPRQYLPIFQR
ncbi:MAG: terpene cyclase/mutase family protein [Planctomycetes bacterium]|nr:terpene cyclase/mutase family protein [Planctomycetota bacterium]